MKIDIRKSLHRKCVGRRSNFLITNNILYSIVFTLLKLCMYLPISSINHYGACSPGLEGENSSKSLEIQLFSRYFDHYRQLSSQSNLRLTSADFD